MNEVYRILKPNGKFVVLTPDWISNYKNYWDDYTHRHPFTLTSLRNILLAYNFKVIYCKKFIQLPFLWGLKYFSFSDFLKPKKLAKFLQQKMLLGIGEK
jgi:SAM-dependent methyltransferase